MHPRTILLACAALGAVAVLATPPPPRVAAAARSASTTSAGRAAPDPLSHDFGAPVFSADARGDLVTIGNVTTTCDPTYVNANWTADASDAACRAATTGAAVTPRFDGTPMPPINNRLPMTFVDVDGDPSTFASSRARLALPDGAHVLWAGLHWNAATEVPIAAELYGSDERLPPPAPTATDRVLLTTPDGTRTQLTADDSWHDTNPGGTTSVAGYADVTDQVRTGGAGTYTVADVQSCRGFGGCFGSWSLTVAVAHRQAPPRNLNVWHGWQLTAPTVDDGTQEFTVSGIDPPPSGPVQARIGVVQADGDRGLGPDSLEIASPSHPAWRPFTTVDRPLAEGEQDWFNSTVNAYGRRRPDADATPNILANLNQDLALVEDHQVVANTDRSFRFRVRTAGAESLYSQVVHAAVDLHRPTIGLTKTVDPAGPVPRGTEVTWTLRVANDGIDPIRGAVVTDPLPAGLTYRPGTIRYSAGGPAALLGPKTDRPGDDAAEWSPATRTFTLRVGDGATATAGGTLAVAPAVDGSDHLTITFRATVDAAPDASITNLAVGDGEGRSLDDPYGPLTTRAEARAPITVSPEADLGIAKSDGGAVVRAVGDEVPYRITVTNAGPSAASGVQVTDVLDDRLRFTSADEGCTADGPTVRCAIGDLAPGASATRTIVAAVVELPGPGRAIPNVATVHGDRPDPDCDRHHPGARCNRDDEQTPQPPPPPPPPTTTTVAAPSTTAPTPSTAPGARTDAAPPPAPATTPSAGTLPRTGGRPLGLVTGALALLATGGVALAARRRSEQRTAR